MQLSPREQFTITRQLQNPFITDTQYVRAVVRNAKTDAVIATIDLEDKGSQRFSKVWLVPADVSGMGFWISIVTSVYADDVYSVRSQNYGDEENTYLVQERYNRNIGGGVGPDIDYKKIRKIIKEEVALIENEEKEPKVIEVIKEVVVEKPKIVEVIKEVIVEKTSPPKIIETVKQVIVEKAQDLTPITNKLSDILKLISAIELKPDQELRSVAGEIRKLVTPIPLVPVVSPYADKRILSVMGKIIVKKTPNGARVNKLLKQ
jgi:hypothetical protein